MGHYRVPIGDVFGCPMGLRHLGGVPFIASLWGGGFGVSHHELPVGFWRRWGAPGVTPLWGQYRGDTGVPPHYGVNIGEVLGCPPLMGSI